MLRKLKSRPAIAVVSFVVGATIAAGVAWAAIPSSTAGTITACYPTSGTDKGALRVIDYQAGAHCRAGEAMVKWQADGMRWRGAWSSTKTYFAGDVVARAGSSYIATTTSSNVMPPNTTYWAVMAAKGASGTPLCGGYPHANIDWSIPGSTPGNGCNFDLANLTAMSLLGANLTNVHMHGANLTSAVLYQANLTGANLGDAKLNGASLGLANLTNAIVAGANLTNANIEGANLTGASLQSSNLTGAAITGVIWSNTTCPDGTVSATNGTSPESCTGHGGGL
jgi:hypothetical protein